MRGNRDMKKFCGSYLSTVLTILLLPLISLGGGFIRGTVTSAIDGKAISGAHVMVPETGQGTTTDTTGNFTLQLPGGSRYRIRVSHLGYLPQEKSVKLPNKQTDRHPLLRTQPEDL